jgi:hypothetical protein
MEKSILKFYRLADVPANGNFLRRITESISINKVQTGFSSVLIKQAAAVR